MAPSGFVGRYEPIGVRHSETFITLLRLARGGGSSLFGSGLALGMWALYERVSAQLGWNQVVEAAGRVKR